MGRILAPPLPKTEGGESMNPLCNIPFAQAATGGGGLLTVLEMSQRGCLRVGWKRIPTIF